MVSTLCCRVALLFLLVMGRAQVPCSYCMRLLSVLGHATFSFPVLAALVFVVFCECPTILDLAKQRCENLLGVSEVRKNNFSLYFCWLCFFVLVFFSLLRSRTTYN